jgi:hypothetical protein
VTVLGDALPTAAHACLVAGMVLGVGFALVGTVLCVVFGPNASGSCHSLEELKGFWSNWVWWLFLSLSLAIAAFSLVTYKAYARRLATDNPGPHHRIVMPLAFTLSSTLAGGAQMIVHSKVFSELLGLLVVLGQQGSYWSLIKSWLLYVEVVLVVGFGITWTLKLTECLGLFDPLLILPLMVGGYILFGGVAGGIFFREFDRLHEGGPAAWPLYIIGVLCVLMGLALIAVASAEVENDDDDNLEHHDEAMAMVEDADAAKGAGTTASDLVDVDAEMAEALTVTEISAGCTKAAPRSWGLGPPVPILPPVVVPELSASARLSGSMLSACSRQGSSPTQRRRLAGGHMPTPGALRAEALHEFIGHRRTSRAELPPPARWVRGAATEKHLFVDPCMRWSFEHHAPSRRRHSHSGAPAPGRDGGPSRSPTKSSAQPCGPRIAVSFAREPVLRPAARAVGERTYAAPARTPPRKAALPEAARGKSKRRPPKAVMRTPPPMTLPGLQQV